MTELDPAAARPDVRYIDKTRAYYLSQGYENPINSMRWGLALVFALAFLTTAASDLGPEPTRNELRMKRRWLMSTLAPISMHLTRCLTWGRVYMSSRQTTPRYSAWAARCRSKDRSV